MRRKYTAEEHCRIQMLLLCNVDPHEIARRLGRSYKSLQVHLSEKKISVFRFRQRYKHEVLDEVRTS